jgi:hypothetical protein
MNVRDLKRLMEQWQHAHLDRHILEQKALDIARTGDSAAIEIARLDVDRRLESMNELRAQINTERGSYVLRDRYDADHATLRDSVDARLKILESVRANLEGRIWMLGGAISFAVIVLNLALYYFRSHP